MHVHDALLAVLRYCTQPAQKHEKDMLFHIGRKTSPVIQNKNSIRHILENNPQNLFILVYVDVLCDCTRTLVFRCGAASMGYFLSLMCLCV